MSVSNVGGARSFQTTLPTAGEHFRFIEGINEDRKRAMSPGSETPTPPAYTPWPENGAAKSGSVAATGSGVNLQDGNGSTRLEGTAHNDTLSGGNGSDTLIGLGGDDRIDGGNDADWIDNGAGRDTVEGGNGDDTFVLSNGSQSALNGGNDNDTFKLGAGVTSSKDMINGGNGHDVIDVAGRFGEGGYGVAAPTAIGGGGGQVLIGNGNAIGLQGVETIKFENGTFDVASGKFTANTPPGGGTPGDDRIDVKPGSPNEIDAGAGNDTIVVSPDAKGQYRLVGGEGADTVVLQGARSEWLDGFHGADVDLALGRNGQAVMMKDVEFVEFADGKYKVEANGSLTKIDQNPPPGGSHEVNYEDVAKSLNEWGMGTAREKYDRDGNGVLNLTESQALLKAADANGDGKVTEVELNAFKMKESVLEPGFEIHVWNPNRPPAPPSWDPNADARQITIDESSTTKSSAMLNALNEVDYSNGGGINRGEFFDYLLTNHHDTLRQLIDKSGPITSGDVAAAFDSGQLGRLLKGGDGVMSADEFFDFLNKSEWEWPMATTLAAR